VVAKKAKDTHINTMKYNKQEKEGKKKRNKETKSNEQVFIAQCNYVQYYYINISLLYANTLACVPCNFTESILETWKFIFERCRIFYPKVLGISKLK